MGSQTIAGVVMIEMPRIYGGKSRRVNVQQLESEVGVLSQIGGQDVLSRAQPR